MSELSAFTIYKLVLYDMFAQTKKRGLHDQNNVVVGSTFAV